MNGAKRLKSYGQENEMERDGMGRKEGRKYDTDNIFPSLPFILAFSTFLEVGKVLID
jgi:hypothetical protein